MPKVDDVVTDKSFNATIDSIKTVSEVRGEPLDIPPGFYWSNVNIADPKECDEVYNLLT